MRSTAFLGVLATARVGRAEAQRAAQSRRPDPTLIEDLVAANRILADQGILDGYGHVSVRHDANPNRYLLSRDRAPALVTAEDITEYDLESNPIEAGGRAGVQERFIHGEIYKVRADVKAVVHSHSAAVIPYSVTGVPLRPVFHMAAFIADGVPVFDSGRSSSAKHVLIRTREAGQALAQTLGSRPAVLILGHGAAVTGTSLPMAVGRAIYLDTSARIQTEATTLGGVITDLDAAAAREVANNDYGRAWELWKRKAMQSAR